MLNELKTVFGCFCTAPRVARFVLSEYIDVFVCVRALTLSLSFVLLFLMFDSAC